MKDDRPIALVVGFKDRDRQTLMDLVARFGLQGVAVATAGEALDSFVSRVPDLVLSSFLLPDMEGLDFVREIRELSTTLLIGILAEWRDRRMMREVLHVGRIELLRIPIREREADAMFARLFNEAISSLD